MAQTTLHATIPTQGGDFPAIELMVTLARLRGLYFNALEDALADLGSPDPEVTVKAVLTSVDRIRDQPDLELRGMTILATDYAIDQDGAELIISDIQRSNPIEIYMVGLAFPLTVAVVLSGGTLQLGPLKVELPPLGKGISLLRQALLPIAPAMTKPLTAEVETKLPKAKLPRLRT